MYNSLFQIPDFLQNCWICDRIIIHSRICRIYQYNIQIYDSHMMRLIPGIYWYCNFSRYSTMNKS